MDFKIRIKTSYITHRKRLNLNYRFVHSLSNLGIEFDESGGKAFNITT